MICPKCKVTLKDKSNYCVRCGATFNENGEIINNPDEEKISFDELLRLYVGKNFDKFEDNPFSVWQFLFGGFYSFYRRYYSYGIFYIITMIASSIFISKTISFIASLEYYGPLFKNKILVNIIELLFLICISYFLSKNYNRKYLLHANSRIKKILFSKKQYSKEELKKKCISKGKPSILRIIISYAIISFSIFMISFTITLISTIKIQLDYKKAQLIGKNICSEIKNNISTEDFTQDKIDKTLEIDKYTNNKYTGFFKINSQEKIELLYSNFKNIVCKGTCNQNVICEKETQNN